MQKIIQIVRYLTLAFALFVPFALWFKLVNQYFLWDVSWYAVTALMLIRPLADIFPRFMFLRFWIPYRKELGILSAMVVVASGVIHYFTMADPFLATYFSLSFWSLEKYRFFAHLGELTGLILLVTSNKLSQRLLKADWKKVQYLSYVYFFSGGIYILYLGKVVALYSMIAVAVLWVLAHFGLKIMRG